MGAPKCNVSKTCYWPQAGYTKFPGIVKICLKINAICLQGLGQVPGIVFCLCKTISEIFSFGFTVQIRILLLKH